MWWIRWIWWMWMHESGRVCGCGCAWMRSAGSGALPIGRYHSHTHLTPAAATAACAVTASSCCTPASLCLLPSRDPCSCSCSCSCSSPPTSSGRLFGQLVSSSGGVRGEPPFWPIRAHPLIQQPQPSSRENPTTAYSRCDDTTTLPAHGAQNHTIHYTHPTK